ncbi:S-adenosyl-L-methionine-dependent methyltransferase [Xylariaceae sp. AK1471]|nr:S-adenosyl-L-methionine-dependent methyltransferase [Xylariaceae sp. AK1471]
MRNCVNSKTGGLPRSGVKREWDAEENPIDEESARIEKRLKNLSKLSKQSPIEIPDDEDEELQLQKEEKLLPTLANVIDLTDDTPDTRPRSKTLSPIRNPSVPDYESLDRCDFNGVKLEPGSTVEIQEQLQLSKASFLWITHIIMARDGLRLRGIPLTRMRNLRGRLPRLRNEVAMILHVDNDDKRSEEIQAAIEVSIAEVSKPRYCHFTNADFPRHRTVLGVHSSIADVERNGVLMCRWRCIFQYKDASTRMNYIDSAGKNAAPAEFIVEHLSAKHFIKTRFRVPEPDRLFAWRGGRVRGGEYDPGDSQIQGPVVQLDGKEESEWVLVEKKQGQRYTFGDMFCGAGGASLGAQKAGFHVKVGCDHNPGACNTYREVFPDTELHESDIFDFITSVDNSKLRVDVLHLSPPCQFWSPAHTVAGVNDDANIAVLFSCHELIKKHRPRLFTLEQTFGILHPRFEYYFNALIHGFTENSYSVRWKIVNLIDWGSPATRKRLVMIGSCPGEDLPPFPEATHVAPGSKMRGKKPHLTVKKMLARIPWDASQYDDMHQPHEMVRKRLERWDPDVTLKRCITTNGGYGNYHPSGRRDFTLREYATLQTFPVDYPFQNPQRKRQIGNAFPPMVVKALYTHLRKWLENKDCVYAIENEPIDSDDPDIEVFDVDEVMEEAGSDEDDVEYMGSQQMSSPYGSSGDSSYQDDMDLDVSDDDDYSPALCIDVNQRRQVWLASDRTGGWVGGHGDCIDLTEED